MMQVKWGTATTRGVQSLVVLYLAGAIAPLAGCALSAQQKAAILRFGTGAAELADVASVEFVQSRQDVVDMAKLRNQLYGTLPKPLDGSVQELLAEPLDRFLTAERVQTRVEALAALKAYAVLLQTLATSDHSAELRAAAEGFTAALQRAGVAMSARDADAITLAVDAVGGLLIEWIRRDAVIKSVRTADPYVRQLLDLLERSFDPEDEYWALAYREATTTLRAAAQAADAMSSTGETATPQPAVMIAAQEARDAANENESRFEEISAEIRRAVEGLRIANRELVGSVAQPVFSVASINEFLDRVEALLVKYEVVRGGGYE